MPSEENSIIGARSSSKFMNKRLVHTRRGAPPLPIRDGLNPSRVRVPQDLVGMSAREFVTRLIDTQRHRHPDDDAQAIELRFAAGDVVDGRGHILTPDSVLTPGVDVWFYRIPAPEIPVPYEIKVIHEDERILVADKPPFLSTIPRGQHITETATVRLRRMTGIADLSPAHRLDRLTSGILLFTKLRNVRGAYQTLFARQEVTKTYEALAPYDAALADSTPMTWANRIHKEPGQYQATLVEGEVNAVTTLESVEAVSDEEQLRLEGLYGPLPRIGRYTLKPKTGKTHQLRLHMWDAGVPMLGDDAYPVPVPAAEQSFSTPLQLLAQRIDFIDPVDHIPRSFEVPRR